MSSAIDRVDIDAMLVLNRGLTPEAELTPDTQALVEAAVDIGSEVAPGTIIFSGGLNWQRNRARGDQPRIAEVMIEHAEKYASELGITDLPFDIEPDADSMIDSFVNINQRLDLGNGDRLGVVGAKLPFLYGRARRISKLVLPKVEIVPMPVQFGSTARQHRNEFLLTAATQFFMAGARKGDVEVINRRQDFLRSFHMLHAEYLDMKDAPDF